MTLPYRQWAPICLLISSQKSPKNWETPRMTGKAEWVKWGSKRRGRRWGTRNGHLSQNSSYSQGHLSRGCGVKVSNATPKTIATLFSLRTRCHQTSGNKLCIVESASHHHSGPACTFGRCSDCWFCHLLSDWAENRQTGFFDDADYESSIIDSQFNRSVIERLSISSQIQLKIGRQGFSKVLITNTIVKFYQNWLPLDRYCQLTRNCDKLHATHTCPLPREACFRGNLIP